MKRGRDEWESETQICNAPKNRGGRIRGKRDGKKMDTSDLIAKVTRSIKYSSSVNIAFVSL